ncbi:MAG TPA: GNAT family N-acetyltransferase [Xanthobacteraceae bacterium]|nr:GNAT family N-acetyltransferase [Xanthobacteraceae bacterium]
MHDTPETSGVIRKLWIGETDRFRKHLLRLDPESRANRFGTPVTDYFIEKYAAKALGPDSVVHGFFVDGVLRGCAELRVSADHSPDEGEAAFSIERPWQNAGVGSALMGRTILAARNRAIRKLYMNCLSHNHPMQAIARKYEADLRFEANDVVAEIINPHPNPLSLFREFMADSHSLATTILDAQSRMLKAA